MSFELKVSKILRPCSSLASFTIRLRSTSSGPNRLLVLQLAPSHCGFFPGPSSAMIVLSLAFHSLPSSSYLPWSLTKEVYEFCTCVGGVVLLESGGATTGETSHLISSCVSVQQCARLLGKEKDCGSTNSQSEQQGEISNNSVTTDEGETGTSITSGTTRTSHETSSRSDRSPQAPPRGVLRKHQLSISLP